MKLIIPQLFRRCLSPWTALIECVCNCLNVSKYMQSYIVLCLAFLFGKECCWSILCCAHHQRHTFGTPDWSLVSVAMYFGEGPDLQLWVLYRMNSHDLGQFELFKWRNSLIVPAHENKSCCPWHATFVHMLEYKLAWLVFLKCLAGASCTISVVL